MESEIRFLLRFIIILLAMSSKADVDFHFTCSSQREKINTLNEFSICSRHFYSSFLKKFVTIRMI